MKSLKWRDSKGRLIEIHTMSDKWLNNLKKFLKDKPNHSVHLNAIKEELKRRKYGN